MDKARSNDLWKPGDPVANPQNWVYEDAGSSVGQAGGSASPADHPGGSWAVPVRDSNGVCEVRKAPVLYDAYGAPGIVTRKLDGECHLDALRYRDLMCSHPDPHVRARGLALKQSISDVALLRDWYRSNNNRTWFVAGEAATKKIPKSGWMLEASVPSWKMTGLLARYGEELFAGAHRGTSVWDRWLKEEGSMWRVA